MTNLPPGVRESAVDGPPCPECGAHGCDCEPEWCDGLSYRERCEIDKGEMRMERERGE
jgi:hypothetical protein